MNNLCRIWPKRYIICSKSGFPAARETAVCSKLPSPPRRFLHGIISGFRGGVRAFVRPASGKILKISCLYDCQLFSRLFSQ